MEASPSQIFGLVRKQTGKFRFAFCLNTKFERSVFKIDPCLKSRLEQGKVTNVDGLSTVGATTTAHNEALER